MTAPATQGVLVMQLDAVREKFCREYHLIGNASEALRRANPKSRKWKDNSVHVKASTIMAEPKVQLRLQELRNESSEKHEMTVERVTRMLLEDRELARTNAQSGAAVSASMGLAKLHGMIVDKQEVTRKRDVADIEDTELAAIATGSGERAVAKTNGTSKPH